MYVDRVFLQKVSENKHCDKFFIKICLLSFPQAVIGQFNVFHFGINTASPFKKKKNAPLRLYSIVDKAIPPSLFLWFDFDLALNKHAYKQIH